MATKIEPAPIAAPASRATSGPDQQPATRLRGLDGLRGLAVIAVLVFHQDFTWGRGGYLGVSLFFTLSGFLIAGLAIDEVERHGRLGLRSFWARRLRRLAPAALLALLLVCTFGAFVATDAQQIGLRGDVWSSLANVTNWRFVTSGSSYADLFRAPSPVQHFWSLAIEEQFYVVFPLLVAAIAALSTKARLQRIRFRWWLAIVVTLLMGVSVASQLAADTIDRIYYGTDTRAFELLAGVLLACLWRPPVSERRIARAIAVVGAALFVVMVWWWTSVGFASPWLYDGGLPLVAIVSVVVIAAATVPGPVRTIGSLRPLVAVGLISYGLYLYHWPVYLTLDPARTGVEGWRLFALRITVTTAIAVVSYYALEMPFRRGSIGRVRAAPLMWIGALALVAVTVPLAIAQSNPLDSYSDQQALRAATVRDGQRARDVAAAAAHAPPLKAYVIGDSTGAVFAAGLAKYGARTGDVEVRTGTIEACPFGAVESFKFWVYGPYDITVEPPCRAAPRRWAADLASFHPDVVIVVAGPTNTSTFRPSGSPPGTVLKPTDPSGRAVIADGVSNVARLLHRSAPNAPQLWLTAPYAWRIDTANGSMADPLGPQVPAYTDVYNSILADLARTEPWAVDVPWASRFDDAPLSQDSEERPDGVHASPATIDQILDEWFPILQRARLRALDVNAIGALSAPS